MALINCPECSKEISDKAPACIHCGYPLKTRASKDIGSLLKGIPAQLKSKPAIVFSLVAIIVVALAFAFADKPSPIVGTWEFKEYRVGGKTLKNSELTELFGTSVQNLRNVSFTFYASGTVRKNSDAEGEMIRYRFSDDTVYLLDEDRDVLETFYYVNGTLIFEYSYDEDIVFKKRLFSQWWK